MGRLAASWLVWGPWVAYFLAAELYAVFTHNRHYLTLSSTVDDVERRWWPVQFIILVGLAVLMVHWFAGGPVKLAAAAVARRLPGRGGPAGP